MMTEEADDAPKLGEDAPPKNRGNAGKGRPKGSVNKHTMVLKEAALLAAARAGGKVGGEESVAAYLDWAARTKPEAFMTLLTKILPMQIEGGGSDGEHVVTLRWEQ